MEQLDKRLNLIKNEKEIFEVWEKENIYSKIKEKEKNNEVWRFIDGPPYTTGSIHPGTAWNKILKDYLIKYKRMRGYKVTDTPGYDTHGLPIEVQMEKELGIDNKQEIYEYGVDKFIKNCKEFAEKNLSVMNEQFKSLGCNFWDWDNPYITFKNSYIEGIWWTLKRAWENDMLYQFYRPLNCCPRCATALAKHEHEYEEIKDTSLFLKIKSTEMEKTYFIIWTTTPWTLVANTAIMANPKAEYVKVYLKDLDEYWILSKQSVTFFISGNLGYKYKIVEDFYGEELEGKKYEHPLIDEVPYQKELSKESDKVHSVILSEEYVSVSEAVGLVHTAPGHGPEDFEVGVEYGLPIFNPVDIRGNYKQEAGEFAGKNIFEANPEILDLLKEKGTLISTGEIEHEYAHCWRCGSKLVYRATRQWFFKTEDLSSRLLEKNKEIYWIPDWAGRKWFKSWLTTLQDWCISRQRFWGIPLSVWICDNEDCQDTIVIGSADELKEKAGECPDDLHRPWIDEVSWECEKCKKGTKKRIKDILDVWLDSGSVMWASQMVYDGKKHFDTWEPADFILEGKDQIRGWFNSLLCSAMISSNRKNYDSCYMHGWMLRDNEKMSKSKGNYFELEDLIEGNIKGIKNVKKFSQIKGIGTFRFYSIGATQPGRDLNFNLKEYTDTFKIINTIWNVYYFASQKFNLGKFDPSKHKIDETKFNEIDKWLLSKINSTIKKVTELSDSYKLPWIPAVLKDFILNDVSRWYIMLNREKIDVYSEDPDKYNIMALLYDALYKFLLMLAPINPMLSEKIYLEMYHPFLDSLGREKTDSIHLQDWPELKEKYIDQDLESQMEFVRELIEIVRSIKNEQRIRLRWPNKRLIIVPKEGMPELRLDHLIKSMTNIKEIQIIESAEESEDLIKKESKYADLYLDISVNKEIIAERVENDLLRNIQYTRKRNDLKVGQPIDLIITTENELLLNALNDDKEDIAGKVSAENIELIEGDIEEKGDYVSNEIKLCPNEKCYASLKSNIIQKVEAQKDVNCPYCGEPLKDSSIFDVKFQFKRL